MERVTETELIEKAVAPRVTEKELEANISSVHYFTAADGVSGAHEGSPEPWVSPPDPLNLLTICVIVLANGFTVTGESACASPENFNQDIGQRIAYENAKNKIWPLMGYALREMLNPPQHRYWRPGEPDCPTDIKAGNGELHTLRCKTCGLDDPRNEICLSVGRG